MFDIHCHHCDRTYLVGRGAIDSFHNTSEGPIAYVSCPRGHRLMRRFRHGFDAAAEAAPTAAQPLPRSA